jgi:hypothetical protein
MTKRDPKEHLMIPKRAARAKGDMFANLRKPEEIESLTLEEIASPFHPASTLNRTRRDQTHYDQSYDDRSQTPPLTGRGDRTQRDRTPRDQPLKQAQSSPPIHLLAALPDAKGHLELPHQISDHLLRQLDPFEQVVYLQLYRLAWGRHTSKCIISNEKLAERANVGLTKVKQATKSLEAKGLIKKTQRPHGSNIIQGIHYEVSAPEWALRRDRTPDDRTPRVQTQGDHNKERVLKETNKDASACPDCFGTNWHYPDGTNKGVRRCAHEKMK